MTARVHDPTPPGGAGPDPARTPVSRPAARPWWLLPGAAGAFVIGGLVVAGVLSLETVLYVGMFGGMILMHVGGHGHGGNGGHDGGKSPGSTALRQGSSDAQPRQAGSTVGLEPRADDDSRESGTHDHDQHSSHGCH